MDTTQWPQEIMVKPLATTNTSEKKPRPEKQQAINCPRCNSINTKFCYYNNYSLTQPRYFCKTCRRYWTQGGSIRNIPVGGGSRKNNKLRSSSNPNPNPISNATKNLVPNKIHHHEQGQDLNLDFPSITLRSTTTSHNFSALELLTGINASSSRGFHSFMPVQLQGDANTNVGFPLQDFKQVPMNFCLDGIGGNGYGSEGRVLFPFEDLKQVSSINNPTLDLDLDLDQINNKGDQQGYASGIWNGMLGGGGGYHGN